MNKYPKYKPSGIEWIGEIPEHWRVKMLKYVADINPSKKNYSFEKESEDEIVFLPMEKVFENGMINQEKKKKINEVSTGFTYFEIGDVIVAKITPCFENGKGALLENLETNFGFGSTEFHTMRASNLITKSLLFYQTKTDRFKNLGKAFMTGSAGQKRVPSSFVEDFIIVLPPTGEQTAIANFLDEKTAQIDKLITSKQKLIQLLKEERAAIINQAVTRGINPNAKLKFSGIDWLGDIPEHWEIKRLKYLCKIGTGSKNTEDRVIDGEYPFFVRSQEIERINSYTFDGEAVLTAGDGVGVAKVFHHYIGKFDYHQRVYCISEFCEVNGKYIYYYLMINLIKEILRYNAKSTVDSLRLPMFQNFAIAYSSNVNEQKQIVKHIESETKRIDSTISKIEREIELLQEYCTALISEVVTGKIDVRNTV